MAVRAWLVDTSALVRINRSPDAPIWTERTQRGLVRISSATLLEVGWSARTGGELRQERGRSPLSLMPVEYLTPAAEDRAREVQALLADRSQHRGPSPVDLLVCAAAELSGLVVLHVDRDIEVVAEVTGQDTERLAFNDSTTR